MDRVPPEEKPKRKYSCGDCGSQVYKNTIFSGWEDETIDMDTGEILDVVDAAREDIHEIQYSCVEGCGWTRDAAWHDDINYGRDEEEEEEEEEIALTPRLFTFTNRPTTIVEPF